MTCISHFHITLADVDTESAKQAASLVEGKVTTIDLVRGITQRTDRMLTKYQKGDGLFDMEHDVCLLESTGYTVVKYKLERMLSSLEEAKTFDVNEKNYVEMHFKVPSSLNRIDVPPFAISSNVENMDHYFYNIRLRSQEQIEKIEKVILDTEFLRDAKRHVEYVVYDSNLLHDRWWL